MVSKSMHEQGSEGGSGELRRNLNKSITWDVFQICAGLLVPKEFSKDILLNPRTPCAIVFLSQCTSLREIWAYKYFGVACARPLPFKLAIRKCFRTVVSLKGV